MWLQPVPSGRLGTMMSPAQKHWMSRDIVSGVRTLKVTDRSQIGPERLGLLTKGNVDCAILSLHKGMW